MSRTGVHRVLTAARISDLGVVVGLAIILALMILPIPTFLLDALIAGNILLAVTLVLVGVYVSSPAEFPVFPSLLLIGTVYRLALSIAATRMILTTGDAGEIIKTFGQVAASGNLIVGVVMFLVISLVQFIVIAKGAERVGEVAARFCLDAMPGKQMSIDSDLRSGLTDKEEARRKRRMLELESKLYGSLDGAMKFIKGDAIAGIFILGVNLVGGLTVGILQRQMSFADALQTYALLTIGDGMVTQIPALLFALAAGLVVTRTAGDSPETHLGEAIRQQILHRPRVPLLAGLLCWVLAAIPGFPAASFLILGAAGVAAGALSSPPTVRRLKALKFVGRYVAERPGSQGEGAVPAPAPVTMPPLQLSLGTGRPGALSSDEIRNGLEQLLEGLEGRYGLLLPGVVYDFDPAVGNGWRLRAHGLLIAEGDLEQERTSADLIERVRQALRRNLGTFVGMQEAATMVNRLSASHPDVAREVVRVLSPMRIAEVMRQLAEEEVSLRPLPQILEALADAAQREKEIPALTAMVRVAVHRHVVAPYLAGDTLRAITIGPALEAQLRSGYRQTASNGQLALSPDLARALLKELGAAAASTGASVIVAPIDLRRPLRKLIEPELFDLPVLAFNELKPPLKLQVVAQATAVGTDSLGAAA